jgi:multicomponent Na+:H+ antiporter subunit D
MVATALVVSVLTLFSMTKIWAEAFWKERPESYPSPSAGEPVKGEKWLLLLPITGLAALIVVMGVATESLLALSLQAAEQLLNPAIYIQAVLGEK